MRPPQFAGEDDAAAHACGELKLTSMRPPQFAGEDDAASSMQAMRDAQLQ